MVDVSSSQVNNFCNNNDTYSNVVSEDIKIDYIDSIFATTIKEPDRTTFEESFKSLPLDDADSIQGKMFLEGLRNNKNDKVIITPDGKEESISGLASDLELNSEQYDALSCIAMALASQETGMGLEDGYTSENEGIHKGLRLSAIYLKHKAQNTPSASSGLTQMKINDFVKEYQNNNSNKYDLFEKYGITTDGFSINNLYENPDKSAIATMIILSDILSGYNDYINILNNGYENSENNCHDTVRSRLDSNLSDEECVRKGLDVIDKIKDAYDTLEPSEQESFRQTLKNWIEAYDGSLDEKNYIKTHKDDKEYKYCEERQLKELNKMLKDSNVEIKQEDLDYIRYALTDENYSMTPVEYCAFAWNRGVNANSMKADRLVATKLGAIFANPEDFDYEQFAINVEILTSKYAQNSNSDIDTVNKILYQYIKN